MQVVAFSAPLLIGSGAKVTYDVLLYKSFRRFKAPEGKPAPTTEGIKPGLSQLLVPKKGLEPPHPCGYMDLNHARLPIPPLRPSN